jgi:hypothetical protein
LLLLTILHKQQQGQCTSERHRRAIQIVQCAGHPCPHERLHKRIGHITACMLTPPGTTARSLELEQLAKAAAAAPAAAAAAAVLTLRARNPAALSWGLYGSGRLMAEDVDVALLGS